MSRGQPLTALIRLMHIDKHNNFYSALALRSASRLSGQIVQISAMRSRAQGVDSSRWRHYATSGRRRSLWLNIRPSLAYIVRLQRSHRDFIGGMRNDSRTPLL